MKNLNFSKIIEKKSKKLKFFKNNLHKSYRLIIKYEIKIIQVEYETYLKYDSRNNIKSR